MSGGSPFSNVVGHNPDEDSTFERVESSDTSDTTSATEVAHVDNPGESSIGVEGQPGGPEHVAGQDETAGDASSGTPTPGL